MDAARSLNSIEAVKTETVQTRQLFWLIECTHTHRTGYFIMKIVQQGLYIHGKDGGNKGGNSASFFVLVVSDLTIQAAAFWKNAPYLLPWERLNINIDLSTNQTELVAFFDILTNILLARIVNLLYKAWTIGCRIIFHCFTKTDHFAVAKTPVFLCQCEAFRFDFLCSGCLCFENVFTSNISMLSNSKQTFHAHRSMFLIYSKTKTMCNGRGTWCSMKYVINT